MTKIQYAAAAAVVLILPGGSLLLPLAWLWRKFAEQRARASKPTA
jgi:hypothetical protein